MILDRRAAIRPARPGDVVILAGEEHQQSMLLADGPVPWDEHADAECALRELGLAALA